MITDTFHYSLSYIPTCCTTYDTGSCTLELLFQTVYERERERERERSINSILDASFVKQHSNALYSKISLNVAENFYFFLKGKGETERERERERKGGALMYHSTFIFTPKSDFC